MKQTINFSQFVAAFNDYDRGDQFSYEGLKALFEYFEEYEEDCGVEVELDVIAICCDFTESSFEDVWNDYCLSEEGIEKEDNEAIMDYLLDRTQVISMPGENLIYQAF